jgi:hypothetical protein
MLESYAEKCMYVSQKYIDGGSIMYYLLKVYLSIKVIRFNTINRESR